MAYDDNSRAVKGELVSEQDEKLLRAIDKAKQQGIPVIYYGAPQMWAWGAWRIGKMRRLVDHLLCKLPFEADWYRERGCAAVYVGHPYFDHLTKQVVDRRFLTQHAVDAERHMVGILPGSRAQEVRANLPAFLRAAEIVAVGTSLQDLVGRYR